ncbi:MAG: hypothetical protein J6S67_19440 [Methanobrevibacter sp.]|nr:hypothetical protein [Methanobrevibacter sp.]
MKFTLVESIILVEDIESMKKYYPNIPDEKFMDYIKLDPTYRGGNNAGTYARWILGLANKNQLDNVGHVRDLLTRFEDNKKNLVSKDIMKFKTMQELEDFLNDENSYKDLSHRQEVRQRQKERAGADLGKEATKVYEDSDWEVWVPKTYAASCKLGQGSSWCTASTESDYYYNMYKKTYGGDYYININKHDPEDKYQFHFESNQFMDKDDYEVDMKSFLKENEGLEKFYKEKVITPLVDKLLKDEGVTISGDGIATFYIDKDDVAKAVSDQGGRDSLPREFVYRILMGEADFDFSGGYSYFDNDKSDAINDIKDEHKELIEKIYVQRNGTDDKDEYDNLDENDRIEYFLDNDSDIYDAVRFSYDSGVEQGSANEATKDILKGITKCYSGNTSPDMLYNEGENKSKFEFDRDDFINDYFDLFRGDENITDVILQPIREGSIYEPRYGWIGYDKEAFNDDLDWRLGELEE